MMDLFGSTIAGANASVFFARDLALGSTAMIAMALAGHVVMGRRRAMARSSLWGACLVGLLILPAAVLAPHRLRLAILPAAVEAVDTVLDPTPLPFEGPSADSVPGPAAISTSHPADDRATSRPEDSGSRIGGLDLGFGLFAVVAAMRAIGLRVAMAAIGRLRRRCRPLDDPRWTEPLDRWRARLGVARPVLILATDRISVPIVVGWLRPVIVVPEKLANAAGPGAIDAILLHELAHVRRGDFGWNLVLKLVQIVYWPHPMVWPVGRIIGAVREQVCDDLCVHALGGAGTYRATLIEVASGLVRRPGPSMGMAMARTTKLGRRLDWIDRTRGASRCLSRWPARLAMGILMIAAAWVLGSVELSRASARPDEPPRDAKASASPRTMDVIVRAQETGRPIAGATIRVTIGVEDVVRKTNAEGRARIVLFRHRAIERLTLDIWAEGLIQQRFFFSQTDARSPSIPERLIADLLPGEQTLGGTVHDEQGRPIRGVKVTIWGHLGEKKRKEELAYMVDTTTDDRGRWHCRCFRDMKFANLYLSHPDYLADDDFHPRRHVRPDPSNPARPGERPLQALLDFSDVQVMTRGVEVSGEVRDEAGKPIEGAEVGWTDARTRLMYHEDIATTTSDARGRFRIAHARPEALVLMVRSRGRAPKRVETNPGAGPLAIVLGPPHRLEGRIVDTSGRPIPGASVWIDAWHTFRFLGAILEADADGRFRWEDAPADPILLDASRIGFVGVFEKVVRAGEEITLTLRRAVRISGTIRDAATQKAIDGAGVEVGAPDPKTGKFVWERKPGVWTSQGQFRATVDIEQTPEFRLRVRADGYEPFESRTFRADEGQVEYDVSLKKSGQSPGGGLSTIAAAGVPGSVELSRASARPVEPPVDATAKVPPRTIVVLVKSDETGRPIEGATIRAVIGMEKSVRKTDRDGRARILLFRHQAIEWLDLDVWAEGYIQQRHFFSQKDPRSPRIPATFTVELLPGEQTLGGTVNDEQGRPILGVKVAIWGYLGEKKRKEELAYMVDATTDDRGRWRCRCFRDMTFANLYLSHLDYVPDDAFHARRHGRPDPARPAQPGEQPLQALRDFSDVQVMIRGVEVAGEVRDEAGKSIEGAEVGWLEATRIQALHDNIATTFTDARGRFRFAHARPGTLVLQVKARAHAPELKRVEAKAVAEPVAIALGPPHLLEGRVVDTKKRPIPGAFVGIDTWRNYRSLGVFLEADADGRFRWEDAPADPVLINVTPTGFDPVIQRRVTAGEELTFILRRAMSISGTIRDAATKKAIDKIEVEVGHTDPDTGKLVWEKMRGVFADVGRLHARIDVERLPEFRLRIKAKGYEPSESRLFRADEGRVEYDFSLKPTS